MKAVVDQDVLRKSEDSTRLKVRHFHRRPMNDQISIERLFEEIRRVLPGFIDCDVRVCPRFSKGFWPRWVNVRDAARHQRPINHITGDVHYLALGLNPRRTLLTIHDCATLERLRGVRLAIFKLFWFTLPIKRAALVTVISESTRRELLRLVKCDAAKVRVVMNCVADEFLPVPKAFNDSQPEILHLGAAANKNLERLVAALTGLPCRLHVVGKLSGPQKLLLQQSGLEYVNTPRATDAELVAAFQRCDMVAFASTYEGFGLPIVEANATGRPVVTSNILSMPEVAGKAACLVDPFAVGSIREGILKVWREADYRQNLVAAGFENVKRFRTSEIAAQYAALYAEMAADAEKK